MARLLRPSPEIAKINITPIIDVALVLVIILLITSPILSVTDREIELPTARTPSDESDHRVHVTLGHTGILGIEDREVSPALFVPVLRSYLNEVGDDALVVVRADRGATHDHVRHVLDEARDAGARRLAFAVRPGVPGS